MSPRFRPFALSNRVPHVAQCRVREAMSPSAAEAAGLGPGCDVPAGTKAQPTLIGTKGNDAHDLSCPPPNSVFQDTWNSGEDMGFASPPPTTPRKNGLSRTPGPSPWGLSAKTPVGFAAAVSSGHRLPPGAQGSGLRRRQRGGQSTCPLPS